MPKKSVKRGVKGAGGAGNEDGGEAQDEDTFQCTLCMRHLHQDVLIEHFKVLHTNLPICVVPVVPKIYSGFYSIHLPGLKSLVFVYVMLCPLRRIQFQ